MKNDGIVIDLVRHAPTLKPNSFSGRTDVALDTTFEERAQRRLTTLASGWRSVISSPLTRCAQHARWLANSRGLKLQLDSALCEYDFGDWDGQTLQSVKAHSADALNAFFNDPVNYPPPNGEALPDFRQRVIAAVTRLGHDFDAPIGVLCHAGVIRVLLAEILKTDYSAVQSIQVSHLSVISIRLWSTPTPVWQIVRIDNIKDF